ncbi:hypothetical protein BH11PLA1_BH11PLA1_00110 [soil metagenome]
MRRATLLILLLFAALAPACAAPQRIDITEWQSALAAVREQSNLSFKAVNALAAQSRLDSSAALPALRAADFAPALPARGVDSWNAALDAIAIYADALSELLDPALSEGASQTLRDAGDRITRSSSFPALQRAGPISDAVAILGARLVARAAERSARAVMLDADPAVNALLTAMARIILDESTPPRRAGLIPTVEVTWSTLLAQREVDYLELPPDRRAGAAAAYSDAVASQDDSLGALLSLRAALLDLARAHSAAAQGHDLDTRALIAAAREDIATLKQLIADLRAARRAR